MPAHLVSFVPLAPLGAIARAGTADAKVPDFTAVARKILPSLVTVRTYVRVESKPEAGGPAPAPNAAPEAAGAGR